MYWIELTKAEPGAAYDIHRSDRPSPRAGRGELRLRQRAASLNFVDLAVATGQYPAPFPLVPLADGAGEVIEVGPDVEGFAVGDRVIVHAKEAWIGGPPVAATMNVMRGISRPGAAAEEVVVAANAVVKAPKHLDFVQAATLPIAATTAWNALQAANVRAGSHVLLLGTGGVSIFALQLAKASGARVTITSSSDEKLERAKALGADNLVNYTRTPEWGRVVSESSDGPPDLVVETGGATTFAQSLEAVRPGGTVFTIGFLSGTKVEVDVLQIISKAVRVHGNNTGSVADLAAATRAIEAAKIVPVVDRVFELARLRDAYDFLAAGRHFGKVGISHGALQAL